MEVVFDFIETNMKAHYSDTAWEKPTSAQLSAALDTLLAPPVAIPNGWMYQVSPRLNWRIWKPKAAIATIGRFNVCTVRKENKDGETGKGKHMNQNINATRTPDKDFT